MEEEQKGVDFFTFDSVQELLNRTKARRNRLNAAKDDGTVSVSVSYSSTSTVTSISNGRGSPLKPLNSNGSLISTIPFADESSIVGKKTEESTLGKKTEESILGKKTEEKTESSVSVISESSGPVSSILQKREDVPKYEEDVPSYKDLPKYKVEIQSRFSPTKKPAAPVYRPSPSKQKQSDIWVSSIALPMPAKTGSRVEPKPCRVPSTTRIGDTGEKKEKEEEKKIEIPESAPISTRIQNLQKLFSVQKQETESHGPERLPVFAKKRLFERRIREEETQAQEGIKRNEYLAQKRGLSSTDISAHSATNSAHSATNSAPSATNSAHSATNSTPSATNSAHSATTSGDHTHRPSVAGMVGNGRVKKMLERLTSPNGYCESSDEESLKPSRRSRVSFKLPTRDSPTRDSPTGDSPTRDSSALEHFQDIDQLSPSNSDAFSPPSLPNVYFNPHQATNEKFPDGYDDMELDSQSSQESSPKKMYNYSQEGSPRKMYNYSQEGSPRKMYTEREEEEKEGNGLYPRLPSVEEADSVHSSPSKRSRFHDDERFTSSERSQFQDQRSQFQDERFYDEERFTSSEETDVSLVMQPSSGSIPLHEAIEKAVNERLGGPLRTLSQYRLEQRKKEETNAAVIPRIVYGMMKRDERKEAVAEEEWRMWIQNRICQLKSEEVPKYETMMEQTSNLLNRLKPSDLGSEAHADSERHLKVLGLKRIAAMNEAHRLQTLLQTKKKGSSDFVTGSIHFDRIDVPVDHQLRLAFSHGLAVKEFLNQFYFVAVSYSGVVHASECRTLREGIASEFLSFKLPHGLKICGVRHDFEVKIEIFGWTVVEEKSQGSKGFKSKLTPKKSKQRAVSSPTCAVGVRDSQFTLRGSLTLTHRNLVKKKQPLTEFLDKSLNGTVDLQVRLEPEFKKSYSNFLHFYEDSDGSWRRRWVKLEGHRLIYWLTPESADRDDPPLNQIDLKFCINPSIARLPSDVCPRKNSFSLILATYPDQTANRINYLLNKNYTSVNRMFVAADVSEDCDEWINQIGSLIQGMRLWDPQALRSCSVADFDRYIRAD